MQVKIRNLVTIGSPNTGFDKVPQCFDGAFCYVINFVANKLEYTGDVQNCLPHSAYFRDANNLTGYKKRFDVVEVTISIVHYVWTPVTSHGDLVQQFAR